jgi:UDP-N-acetylglucosamine--N-acetylmuramyl-(pentapeptide) pyrophosphoryl-undecaprenol N-acetylglucosamine transferase
MANYIFTGGGTGGHIFPAIAIANELKKAEPDASILFVGALGKMEMEKVPQAGYEIQGLPVEGLKRSFSLENFKIVFKAIQSYFKARKLIRKFNPKWVVGTGGYASLPVCLAATHMNIPVYAWEGNAFAGLTNKIISKRAKTIFCGFPGMEAQFKYGNWIHSGNPIRTEILQRTERIQACEFFQLNPDQKIVFITGGSLGAQSINLAISSLLSYFQENQIQIIWQTGKFYKHTQSPNQGEFISEFIQRMDLAYSCADLVISRSGALSVSEILATGVPAVFIPSPNVTDDHQTFNARQAEQGQGSILLKESKQLHEELKTVIQNLIFDNQKLREMRENQLKTARPKATEFIIQTILNHE